MRQYKVTFLRTKRTRIQTSKAHDNLCFPLRRAYLVPLLFALVRVMVIFTNSVFLPLSWLPSHAWERSIFIYQLGVEYFCFIIVDFTLEVNSWEAKL